METIIGKVIEVVTMVLARLIIMGVGIAAAYLMKKLADKKGLERIARGVDLVAQAVQTTVLELQQTVVADAKEAAADGKLSWDLIKALRGDLNRMSKEKLSPAIIELLTGAGYDIDALITGFGEALIWQMPHSPVTEIKESKPPDETADETTNTEYAG